MKDSPTCEHICNLLKNRASIQKDPLNPNEMESTQNLLLYLGSVRGLNQGNRPFFILTSNPQQIYRL